MDRLWPRGVSKKEAALDGWRKELAPSGELRKWFLSGTGAWEEFRTKYLHELSEKEDIARKYLAGVSGDFILLYGKKDKEHTHALALKKYLEDLSGD